MSRKICEHGSHGLNGFKGWHKTSRQLRIMNFIIPTVMPSCDNDKQYPMIGLNVTTVWIWIRLYGI